jgi:hypothetical protein
MFPEQSGNRRDRRGDERLDIEDEVPNLGPGVVAAPDEPDLNDPKLVATSAVDV